MSSAATVLDLGAGTGKLTRTLVPIFDRVVAVEPDDKMRSRLVELCPEVEALSGNALEIPLEDSSVEAVFAAECFHWFANERALTEIGRVLMPRGTLVIMWNKPSGSTEPPIPAVEQLLHPRWPKGFQLPLDLNPRGFAPEWNSLFEQSTFDELQVARIPNPQTVDAEGLVAFFGSMGWIGGLPDDERVRLLDEVRTLLTSTEYVLPWDTYVHWTQLLARKP